MERLPPIDSRVETVRLAFGSIMRLCLQSLVYYGSRGVFTEYGLGKKGSLAFWEHQSLPYVASLGMEIGVSMIICPVRYLAAVSTPRFILDYTLTGWSDVLSVLDRFSPGKFAAYALYAFASDDDWNLSFFTWQVPSLLLTLVKLWYRRKTLGCERCHTKRVLFMLPLQLFLRAYLATFSVMIQETATEVVESVVATVLESMVTSYLARHTWPFAVIDDSTSSPGEASDSCEAAGDDPNARKQ